MKAAMGKKVMQSEVNAWTFLMKQMYLAEEQIVELSTFLNMLMIMAQSASPVPTTVKTGMLAVARMLLAFDCKAAAKETFEKAGEIVGEAIREEIKSLREANNMADKLCEVMGQRMRAMVEKVGEDLVVRADTILWDIRGEAEEMARKARELTRMEESKEENNQEWANDPQDLIDNGTGGGGPEDEEREPQGPPRSSYAAATNGSTHRQLRQSKQVTLTLESRQAADKVEAKVKLVYIDYNDPTDREGTQKLTEEELVNKANVVLALMKATAAGQPRDMKFRAVKKQRNGGLMYEVSTKEGALWLKKPEILAEFVRQYDDKARAKGATYPYTARMVPIAFKVDSFDERRRVEEDSGLPRYVLGDIRWIKHESRREKYQKVANLLINFPTAEIANLAQTKDLYICGARVGVFPQHPEP